MPANGTIPGGRLIEVEAAAALARLRSFRAAAAELGMSATALSRAIAALEERIGVQLFARTTRSVAPTAAGERFLARAQPALRGLDLAVAEARDRRGSPMGTLRLTCTTGAARLILEPLLLGFLARYPDMRIDLVTDGRLVDLVAGQFDAGFRIGARVPRDMVRVPVGPKLRSAVVAPPAVVRALGRPDAPEDLLHKRCIRFRRADGFVYEWEFARDGVKRSLDVPGVLTLDEPTLAHQACLAGAGYAYLAAWSVAADLAAGRLESVLEPWLPAEAGLCLYFPVLRHPSAGLAALIAHARGGARSERQP